MTAVTPPEHPDDRPGADASSISDEEWDAFLRDAAEGGGAASAPKEPSARARVVARRLRERDEAAQALAGSGRRRWGRKRTPQPATPPGWRTGPAWQEMNGRGPRRRRVGAVIGVALAVAVALVAVRPSLLTDRLPGGHDSTAAASPSPLPAETALPSAAPDGTGEDARPTRAHPFRGSPAERWADGADAIELPTAKAVGGMSTADVALALRRTKEFLVATNLDPAVLRGGQPTAAMALLDEKQPDTLSWLRRSLRGPDADHDPTSLVSRFDPARGAVAGDAIKVRGHMTFTGAAGEVRVHADYSFVYPVVPASRAQSTDGGDAVERTIVRRDVTLRLLDPGKWDVTRGKLMLGDYNSEFYNSECDVYDGYLHPVFPGNTPTGAPATGPAMDPYDRSKALRGVTEEHCATVTRT